MSAQPLNTIRKADELLELLVEHGELTIAELAEASGEPRTSLYRLIATLEAIGFVEPGRRDNTFVLGMQLYRLGSVVSVRFDVRQAALGPMEHLFDETGETVFLIVRHRFEGVCIERLDGRRVQAMAIDLGGSLPLHLGAGPLLLLAYAPTDVQAAYLAKPRLQAYTERSITEPKAISRRISEVATKGYAVSDEDLVPGIAALAAPVVDRSGQVVAAVSISGAKPTILSEESGILELVVQAAADAGNNLSESHALASP